MATNIASTTFETGPKDDLAVKDVYQKPDKAPVNIGSNKARREKVQEDIQQSRNKPSNAKSALASRVLPGQEPKTIDVAEATERATSIAGGNKSVIRELSSDLLTDVATKMAGAKDKDGLRVDIDGSERFISSADYKSATGVADIINTVTENDTLVKVLDLETEAAFIGSLVDAAVRMRIPEAIDSLLDSMSDQDEARRVASLTLAQAARQSDLTALNKIIDRIGAAKALAKEPTLISMITMYYQIPPKKNRNQHGALLSELLALLNRLDAKWDKVDRDGTEIPALEPFTYASEDALTLFRRHSDYKDRALFAREYPSRDLMQLGRRLYPSMGV